MTTDKFAIYDGQELVLKLGEITFSDALQQHEAHIKNKGNEQHIVKKIEFKDLEEWEKLALIDNKITDFKKLVEVVQNTSFSAPSNPRFELVELTWLLSFPKQNGLSTEEIKIVKELEETVQKLAKFLDTMKGTRRTYHSTIEVDLDKIAWLLDVAKKEIMTRKK